MTRAEAIEVLKSNYPDPCYSLLREAVDMAIKALKQPVWHKYPEEKPPKEDVPYLITCREYLWGEEKLVMEAFWGDVNGVTQWFEIDLWGTDTPIKTKVFAWAEMPEPYQEKEKK